MRSMWVLYGESATPVIHGAPRPDEGAQEMRKCEKVPDPVVLHLERVPQHGLEIPSSSDANDSKSFPGYVYRSSCASVPQGGGGANAHAFSGCTQ